MSAEHYATLVAMGERLRREERQVMDNAATLMAEGGEAVNSDGVEQTWATDAIVALVTLGGNVAPSEERGSLFRENKAATIAVGEALHEHGGFDAMLAVYDAMAGTLLTRGACKELSVMWSGVGDWLD